MLIIHTLVSYIMAYSIIWITTLALGSAFIRYIESHLINATMIFIYIPTAIIITYTLSHLFATKETAQSVLANGCSVIASTMAVTAISMEKLLNSNATVVLFYFIFLFYVPIAATYFIMETDFKIFSTKTSIRYFSWNSNIVQAFISVN